MKVIEGKHYVEGGPACEYQSRVDPSPRCRGGRLIAPKFFTLEGPVPAEDYGECPRCHGTGLQAVEDWTADDCGEWLRQRGQFSFRNGDYENWWLSYDEKGRDLTGIGQCHITLAMRAAVISVAEEEK